MKNRTSTTLKTICEDAAENHGFTHLWVSDTCKVPLETVQNYKESNSLGWFYNDAKAEVAGMIEIIQLSLRTGNIKRRLYISHETGF